MGVTHLLLLGLFYTIQMQIYVLFCTRLYLKLVIFSLWTKFLDLKKVIINLEPEGQGHDIIMGVTGLLHLGPFYTDRQILCTFLQTTVNDFRKRRHFVPKVKMCQNFFADSWLWDLFLRIKATLTRISFSFLSNFQILKKIRKNAMCIPFWIKVNLGSKLLSYIRSRFCRV